MVAVQSVSRLCRFGCCRMMFSIHDLKCIAALCMGPSQICSYYTSTNSKKECYRLLDLLRAAWCKHGSAAWQRALGSTTKPPSHSKART